MDDMLKGGILIGSLLGLGVGTYAGVTVVSVMTRRFDVKLGGPSPKELDQQDSERLSSGQPLHRQ